MCGRYVPSGGSRRSAVPYGQPATELRANMEYGASQDAMVVRHHPETSERHLDLLKWGLQPYFTKDPVHASRPVNARAETV
jgi:putative SOS response-associated peptidase YedK